MIAWLARRRHLLLVLTLVAFHMLVWERGLAGDGWGYFSTLESIIEDHDVDLTNNRYAVINGLGFNEKVQRWLAQYPPGLAFFDAPFYLAGKFAYARGWVRPTIPPEKMRVAYEGVDSQTLARILFVVLAHNVYALLALVLIDATLRRLGFSEGWSAFVTALSFFGSPLHFYAQNGMSHAVSTFVAAAAAYLMAGICVQPFGRVGGWFWFGVTVGLGAVIRYAGALFAVPAGLMLFLLYRKDARRLLASGVAFSAGVLAVLWVIPMYLKLQTGSWFDTTYTTHWVFDPKNPPLWNVLLSPHHGFLLYHPLFFLALAGIGRALVGATVSSDSAGSARRAFAGFTLTAVVALGLVYGLWFTWWGGDCYSQRFLIETVPFLAAGLAIFLTRGRRVWRVGLTLPLTLISYLFFLLSNAGLVYSGIAHGPGDRLTDYWYALDRGMTIPEVWHAIARASFTLPILERHGALVLAAFLALLPAYAALGRVKKGALPFVDEPR